jgi:hypothetical protein
VTIAKLRWLLGKATSTLGEKRIVDLSPKDVYAWRLTVPEGHRFEAGAATGSQLCGRLGCARLQPGEAWCPEHAAAAEGEAAVRVLGADRGDRRPARTGGRTDGDFGAATGLRPSELFGLEQHDVDRELGVVYVRRAYANGRIKNTKTRLSTRAVPLQAKAVEALERLPASVNPILFPNARGGRIDFRVFGRRHWRPAQIAAGVEPTRGLYNMRHTYATFALRAGVPVFAVSRFIGSSIAMIDRHYGHLARDSVRSRCSTRSRSSWRWTPGWTSNRSRTTRSSTPIRRLIGDELSGAWTLGGRRGSFSSPPPTTNGAD